MEKRLDISVVVPLYNEEESLPELTAWIDRVARENGLSYEIVFVDDGSANMVNLAIRLTVALIFAPRFGIEFVWLAVPAGWFANFVISYVALRKSWPTDKAASVC